MLLQEIFQQLEEESTFDQSIRQHLSRLGYRFLGQGVDQMAFTEPNDRPDIVFKVFGTGGRGLSASQKMFLIWAQFCASQRGNPFLPRFYGYEQFRDPRGRIYIQMRQERLTRGAPAVAASRLAMYIDSMPQAVLDSRWLAQAIIDPRTHAQQLDRYLTSGDRRNLRSHLDRLSYLGPNQLLLLAQTIIAVTRLGRANGWMNDLHSGNIMFRGNVPVLVDPWTLL